MSDTGNSAKEVWDPGGEEISVAMMSRRITATLGYKAWSYMVREMALRNRPVEKLSVLELGCGTGTTALTFALLGATVTLVDYNRKALDRARGIYGGFGCEADFVEADCLKPVPAELEGKFDIVISSGLAEHFTGRSRLACIAYHRSLLNSGGMAVIGVPNGLSPFYRLIRWFRTLTGTWDLDVEVPFTNGELKELAKSAGFGEFRVFGATSLWRDLLVYSRGLISAVADICPAHIRDGARKWKKAKEEKASFQANPIGHSIRICREAAQISSVAGRTGRCSWLSDRFSSGLNLAAFR